MLSLRTLFNAAVYIFVLMRSILSDLAVSLILLEMLDLRITLFICIQIKLFSNPAFQAKLKKLLQ